MERQDEGRQPAQAGPFLAVQGAANATETVLGAGCGDHGRTTFLVRRRLVRSGLTRSPILIAT
ncbi:hypothetical protein SSAG_01395 [Streptomyces sp. Mg1]|nr:hypothetical protein SSAG_01395 [Streptomyces sp. Mg1]